MGIFCLTLPAPTPANCLEELRKYTVSDDDPAGSALFHFLNKPVIEDALIIRSENSDAAHRELINAMNYAVEGGKRLRALLMLAVGEVFGISTKDLLHAIRAIEFLQSASLGMDDLPQHDNAKVRRGRPALHLAYSEPVAQLAVVGLIALSYDSLANLSQEMGGSFQDGKVLRLLKYVSDIVGVQGLTWGQLIDLKGQKHIQTIEHLKGATWLKTGIAFEASIHPVFILLGKHETEQAKLMREFAIQLGIAFQAMDDILAATGTSESIGKDAGIDERQGTVTYVAKLGLEGAQREVYLATLRGLQLLKDADMDTPLLRSFLLLNAFRSK